MDFKNLCQNIDVNSIRARIPSLPAMPTLPQIKLPKSLPKLRSRRIFSRSREDISKNSPKHQQQPEQSQPPPIPPSEFINYSPRRISTISSLMNQRGERNRSTYRSAGSVDDDYPTPKQFHKQIPRPISPINTPIDISNDTMPTVSKLSLTEKLHKGYKDITEFRLSHIFAKKTVVRRDAIQVDHYVQRYNEDREYEMAEQEKCDHRIADNYRFKFKVSRQDTKESKRSLSSNESVELEPKEQRQSGKVGKSVSEHSGDESGMEASPPVRQPVFPATRSFKIPKPPLQRSISVESNNELNEDEELPASKHNLQANKSSPETVTKKGEKVSKSAKALSKLRNIGKTSNSEVGNATGEKKRQAPLSPQQSMEQDQAPIEAENAFSALKQNLKRLQKSIKRPQPAQTDESEGEDAAKETKNVSRTEKIAARLRRLTSHENSADNLDETGTKEETGETKSPLRTAITNRIQNLKKSFKKKASVEAAANMGEETSPEKEIDKDNRSDKLIKKLRNIRNRKTPNSSDNLDATEDEDGTPTEKSKDTSTRKKAHFEETFEKARKRTFKKVNEKMQQIKFFHKSQDNIDNESAKKSDKRSGHERQHTDDSDLDEDNLKVNESPKIPRRAITNRSPVDSDEEDEEQVEEIEPMQQNCITQKTRTRWTTKNLLSDSLDSETDSEFPRVLIHQDNTDQFESTLIIAVTCPAPPVPTATIEEITENPYPRHTPTPTPSNRSVEWIPNTEIISSFLEITPPTKRRLSAEAILPAPRGHARNLSVDSNSDSDSWIPENVLKKPMATVSKQGSQERIAPALNRIDENEEPWKVHTMFCEEKLYKTKSIDIFEANNLKGGVEAVFDDFEEELKNEPILKVPQRNIDSFDKDSSEEPEAADDDNSSRVTKIRVSVIREEREKEEEEISISVPIQSTPAVPTRHFGNSCESLIANLDENEQNDEASNDDSLDDDDDDRPSAAPSPPPNMSPPPPPLPKRKPAIRTPKPIVELTTLPTLPATKPPVPSPKPPPQVPERTPSMTHIAKPLVKTSSLRLAYNEQVKPADVGKVNKLISRFEQPPAKLERPRLVPRRLMREESDEYSDDDDDQEDDKEDQGDPTDESGDENANAKVKSERDVTPTPTNTPRTGSVESTENLVATRRSATTTNAAVTAVTYDTVIRSRSEQSLAKAINKKPIITVDAPKMTLNIDVNSNTSLSRASSEYGSPLEYPSSLIGSTETTPIPDRRQNEWLGRNAERSRRSMTRDDDKFLSFDSDDENSYYSISSSGSSRYVVEI